MGCKSPVRECRQAGPHNEGQSGASTRLRQLRSREAPWEGSPAAAGSKLMSRRTERPYKVDGAGRLAPHSEARCSAPACPAVALAKGEDKWSGCAARVHVLTQGGLQSCPPATAGAAASNDRRAVAGVSRGRSTESHEPGNEDTGWPHNSGRAELGRQTRPSWVLTWSDEAERLSIRAAITVAEKEWLVYPSGLPGTSSCGPAWPVVWESGGSTSR